MACNEIGIHMDNSDQNSASTPEESTGKQWWKFGGEKWWTKFFKLSCMLGVLTDPFFFYVPIVNEKEQCIRMDKASMIGTIISRAIADIPYVVHIISGIVGKFCKDQNKHKGDRPYQQLDVENTQFTPTNTPQHISNTTSPSTEATLGRYKVILVKLVGWERETHFVMDLYAIVPLLYVIVLSMYSHNNTNTSFGILQFSHFFVLIQYIPRVARVYQLAKKGSEDTRLVWLQRLSFSIFLFILASHVVGSFWYISSIQRLMACWKQYNCGVGNEKRCQIGTLFCDNPASRNFTSLKFSCQPSDVPNTNTTHFDYGIFLDLIKSKLLGKPNVRWPPQKLIYCFWWGLQNLRKLSVRLHLYLDFLWLALTLLLRSLGQNLKTSTDIYENYFAILIFVSGMVIYSVSLSGNLELVGKSAQEKKIQQKMDTKEKKIQQKMDMKEKKVTLKMKMMDKELRSWLSKNGLDDENMKEIMKSVKEELEQNRDVHMENILSILLAASEDETNISSRLRLACLKKVPELEDKDQQTLEKMCKLLRLVMYPEASYIIREGEPHDMILFIVQGLVRVHTTYESGRINSSFLETGDIYGKDLINTTSSSDLPITNRIVKSVTRVGAFALLAEDLNQPRTTSVL